MTLLIFNAGMIVIPISLGRLVFEAVPRLPITHGIKCNGNLLIFVLLTLLCLLYITFIFNAALNLWFSLSLLQICFLLASVAILSGVQQLEPDMQLTTLDHGVWASWYNRSASGALLS